GFRRATGHPHKDGITSISTVPQEDHSARTPKALLWYCPLLTSEHVGISAAGAAWEAGAAATATGSRAAVAAKTDRARRSFMKISFPVLRTLEAFVSSVTEL
ncbi:hypothetical protein, partial [Streptomyces nigrescens]|uniref:hypothetical protein n=1 Tax=Streptomyces nigrescens TaxID=1920 RepID=UPI00347DA445